MSFRKLFAVAVAMGCGVASSLVLAFPNCTEEEKVSIEAARNELIKHLNQYHTPQYLVKQALDEYDQKAKCKKSDAPDPGKQGNSQSAQQTKPKEDKRRSWCEPGTPPLPEPAARTTTGMAAQAPDFYTSCSAEKNYMSYQWKKMCLNGPLTEAYEGKAATMDAAAARNRLNEIENPRILYQDRSLPENQALDVWEACLMKTRLRQLADE